MLNENIRDVCTIYDGQSAEEVAAEISKKHGLDKESQMEIEVELEKQFKSLLIVF